MLRGRRKRERADKVEPTLWSIRSDAQGPVGCSIVVYICARTCACGILASACVCACECHVNPARSSFTCYKSSCQYFLSVMDLLLCIFLLAFLFYINKIPILNQPCKPSHVKLLLVDTNI